MTVDGHVHIGKSTRLQIAADGEMLVRIADTMGFDKICCTDLTALFYDMCEGSLIRPPAPERRLLFMGRWIIRCIGVWESHDRLRLAEKVGAADMLHCSALGKAYLAYLPNAEVRALFGAKRLPSLTKNIITSLVALKAELETIRKEENAVDDEEGMLGACCVGCVILNPEQTRPIASVSISDPIVRMNHNRIAEVGKALKATTLEIQKKLGRHNPDSSDRKRRSNPISS